LHDNKTLVIFAKVLTTITVRSLFFLILLIVQELILNTNKHALKLKQKTKKIYGKQKEKAKLFHSGISKLNIQNTNNFFITKHSYHLNPKV
jgi:hypothetical protein